MTSSVALTPFQQIPNTTHVASVYVKGVLEEAMEIACEPLFYCNSALGNFSRFGHVVCVKNGTVELDVYVIEIYGLLQERPVYFWAFAGGIA